MVHYLLLPLVVCGRGILFPLVISYQLGSCQLLGEQQAARLGCKAAVTCCFLAIALTGPNMQASQLVL